MSCFRSCQPLAGSSAGVLTPAAPVDSEESQAGAIILLKLKLHMGSGQLGKLAPLSFIMGVWAFIMKHAGAERPSSTAVPLARSAEQEIGPALTERTSLHASCCINGSP